MTSAGKLNQGESKRKRREIQLNDRAVPDQKNASIVFLVHDGLGEILHYRNLARLLGPEVLVYGLYPTQTNGVALMHTRIEDIAAEYVERAKALQPEGPYMLGGLCAGGVIAHAMACQLQEQGAAVNMLALIEAGDVNIWRKIAWIFKRQTITFRSEFAYPESNISTSRLSTRLRMVLDAFRLLRRKVTSFVKGIATSYKLHVYRYTLDKGLSTPAFARDLSLVEIYSYAVSSYAARVFQGDALLFRATNGDGTYDDEPIRYLYRDSHFGWSKKVNGIVNCLDVPGGHHSLLVEPAAVASSMRKHILALRETQGVN